MDGAEQHSTLTPAVRQRLAELKGDYPTFASKLLRIRPKGGGLKSLALNRAQLYIHQEAEDQKRRTGRVRKLIVKGRQQGCSTYVEGRAYHYTTTRRGVHAFILAHEQEATNNIFEMAARFYEHCPPQFRPHLGAANAKELHFDRLDSSIKVGTAGTKATGRSQTIQFFHGSEVGYWPFADTHAGGVMQAIPDMDDTEGWLESTAAGRGNYFHTQAEKARRRDGSYELIFIPWFWEPGYSKPVPDGFKASEDEMKLAKQFGLTDGQLIWRREKISDLEMKSEFGVTALTGIDRFKQEYPCTFDEAFDAIIPGAYYAKLMEDASNENRIGREPYDALKPVSTAWDLGYGDTTAIWFYQQRGLEVRLIDYYEMSGVGLDHYAKTLRDKGYRYESHNWPHDGGNGDFSTGKTRVQLFSEMGFSARVLNRESNVADGINAVRLLLPRCCFDAAKCEQGIEALRQYRCRYNEDARIFEKTPLHNWASNGSDAFRTLARAIAEPPEDRVKKPERYRSDGNSGASWMSI
jgi:hypothetical protein